MSDQASRDRRSWLHTKNLALTLTLFCTLFFVAVAFVPAEVFAEPFRSAVTNLVSAALGAGVVGLLWEYGSKRSFTVEIQEELSSMLNSIMKRAGVAELAETEGLLSITRDFHYGIRWTEYIEASESIDICWWSGRQWFIQNQIALKKLLESSATGTVIRVVLPDVKDTRVVEQMSIDSGISVDRLLAAHAEVVEQLSASFRREAVEIYLIPRAPRYMYLRLGHVAMYGIYSLTAGGNFERPTVICDSNMPLGRGLKQEFEALISTYGKKIDIISK